MHVLSPVSMIRLALVWPYPHAPYSCFIQTTGVLRKHVMCVWDMVLGLAEWDLWLAVWVMKVGQSALNS